jgi:hypothetical protein
MPNSRTQDWRSWLTAALVGCALALTIGGAQAQVIGQCDDQSRFQSFAIFPNLGVAQIGNPGNAGQAVRDPSGITFLRMPSVNPMFQGFFVDWSGQLVEINPSGMFPIGFCQFAPGVMPPNPFANIYQPPPMANWGVRTDGGAHQIPEAFADETQRYVRPLYATEQTAQQCLSASGGDEIAFGDCMLNRMLGENEREIYECAKESGDEAKFALCTMGAVGGTNERRAAAQLATCYDQAGTDWERYPLCMAQQNMDPNAARLLGCLRDQSEAGEVTFFGTAVCYGSQAIHLNPEQTIAVECAMTTGGQPMAFAGCTGGRLTQRELTKCIEKGVGGDGCFGPNNEIVKALRAVGIDMEQILGPGNPVVRTWNNAISDIQNGPGPNNEVTKAIATVSNDLANGPGRNNDIVQAIDNVVPGFASLF